MSKPLRLPNCDEQALLDQVQVRLVERTELERFKQLLDEHITIWEASKRWANASTTWPPMPRVSGWPCWSSALQPSTSSIETNGSDGALHSATVAAVVDVNDSFFSHPLRCA